MEKVENEETSILLKKIIDADKEIARKILHRI